MRQRTVATIAASAAAILLCVGGASGQGGELDPARNVTLPCEILLSVPQVPRSANKLSYVANKCGFVGTDIEFESRTDSHGNLHHYAFVGSMGGGPRIFDITDPANPTPAGGYIDSGWENDIQVRGDVMINTFDGVNNEPSSLSACLQQTNPGGAAGVDILRLTYDPVAAADPLPVPPDFTVNLIDCVANPPGGAHNSTLAPNGQFLAISNCCSDFAIDVVDLRQIGATPSVLTFRWRLIDSAHANATTCPASGVTWTCVVMQKPNNGGPSAGTWRPHDVFFTADSRRMYVAAINSTWIVDFDLATGAVTPLALIPNNLGDPIPSHNISISHQADTTSDGKILIVSDERGGGLTNTGCNTDPDGVLGGLHFFALAPIDGQPQTANASPTNPIVLGHYFTPPPLLANDPLGTPLSTLRIERACTIHVFRLGGNGSTSPGPIAPGFDGVSSLPNQQLTAAHYGAGSWWLDISGPSSNSDGQVEDPRSTWGNTLGWIVMPGADTWSAKEYKGHVFTGDMVRGMDVFAFPAGPTAVTVRGFRAARTPAGVRVSWETASERNVAGFNVYRGAVRVNASLVRATGRASRYLFVDRTRHAAAMYRLQVIRLDGTATWEASAVAR